MKKEKSMDMVVMPQQFFLYKEKHKWGLKLMKPKILFVIFLIICITNVHSQILTDNFELLPAFSSSFSLSYSENQPLISSLSMGFNLWLFLILNNDENTLFYVLHNVLHNFISTDISINYQYSFIENNNYLICGYRILSLLGEGASILLPMPLIGINGAYNFNKNLFVVIPEIGIHWLIFFELTYRYNMIIDNDYYNKHEFSIKFKIPILDLRKSH